MKTVNLKSIALLAAVFLAGTFIYGEIAARREFKREIRKIREMQERTLLLVDSANANYTKKKLEFLETNQKLYRQLDSILDLKVRNAQRLNPAAERGKAETLRLDSDIGDLKELERERGIRRDSTDKFKGAPKQPEKTPQKPSDGNK